MAGRHIAPDFHPSPKNSTISRTNNFGAVFIAI